MKNIQKIIKAIFKEHGLIHGIKEILPYVFISIKYYKEYKQFFMFIPCYKNMVKYDVLNCRSINRFKEPYTIKTIEKLIPRLEE